MACAEGLLCLALCFGGDEHSFTKIQPTNIFFSEGANVGDFNHDGKPDVVSGPFWYAGPEFTEKHAYYPPKPFDKHNYSDNFFTWTNDFNGDGWSDILVVGFPGLDASWYENPKGSASERWTRHRVVDIVDNESPAFTDINGDGRPDLVCSQRGKYIYASYEPGSAEKPWTVTTISKPGDYQRFTHGLGVGDVNGDGRQDLLEKNGWWEQPSAPSSEPWAFHPHPFSAAGGAQMHAYDFDGDGDNDVLTSIAAHGYGLAWFENIPNDGTITFKRHLILSDKAEPNRHGVVFSQLHAVDLIDMDGDGVRDIVTGKRHWAHGPKGDPDPLGAAVLYWFQTKRSDKQLDFIPHLVDNNTGVGTQVVAADVNNDKLPDIIVGNKLGTFILVHAKK